jgi:hypothetical protein
LNAAAATTAECLYGDAKRLEAVAETIMPISDDIQTELIFVVAHADWLSTNGTSIVS